jgi:hypothetical protein
LSDAIEFAADHVDEIRRMEPSFQGKVIDLRQPDPPLPCSVEMSQSILRLDFLDAVRRGDSREAWQRLRAYWLFDSIHDLAYAQPSGWGDIASYMDLWMEMNEIDRNDVMEALDLVKQGWLDPVSFERKLERSYLAVSQSIQFGTTSAWAAEQPREQIKQEFFRLFPWEVNRSMRLVNLWTARQSIVYGSWRDHVEGKPYVLDGIYWKWVTGEEPPLRLPIGSTIRSCLRPSKARACPNCVNKVPGTGIRTAGKVGDLWLCSGKNSPKSRRCASRSSPGN